MSEKTRVCIAGITGSVGRLLAAAVVDADDLQLVGGTSRTASGSSLAQILGDDRLDVLVSRDVEGALATPTDVLIDYTHPDVVEGNVHKAIDRGVHVVIGTSGLTNEQFVRIEQRAKEQNVGVVTANFSLTAALQQYLANIAARHLPSWEVIDYASETKPDAPSATARELAFGLREVHKPHCEVPINDTKGPVEARGVTLDDAQVHSVRLPGFYSSAEVHFGLPQQRLTIRHDATGPQPYVDGTILAARNIGSFIGLHRSLDKLLEL